jgi:hypothetical protein
MSQTEQEGSQFLLIDFQAIEHASRSVLVLGALPVACAGSPAASRAPFTRAARPRAVGRAALDPVRVTAR